MSQIRSVTSQPNFIKSDTVTLESVGMDGNRWDTMRVSNWYIDGADELTLVPENNTPLKRLRGQTAVHRHVS